jgi:hypothetical protein
MASITVSRFAHSPILTTWPARHPAEKAILEMQARASRRLARVPVAKPAKPVDGVTGVEDIGT